MLENDYITSTDNLNKISYTRYISENSKPTLIFLHGYNSDKNGSKATQILEYCKAYNYNFIAFDNLGHGDSSGELSDQSLGDMKQAAEEVIQALSPGDNILIGSSIGAWIALLMARDRPELIKGVISLAPACDFTENLILANMSAKQLEEFKKEGKKRITGNNPENSYYMSYEFIREARNHLMLNTDSIEINQPVHLLHGTKDKDIPYTYSLEIMQKLISEKAVCKILKGAGHSLSTASNLIVLTNSIAELIEELEY
jgi:pimeloyl-ACP methyl ester carboxylesterase